MMKRLNELSLIEKYFAPLAGVGSFNLKDDAAILTPPKGKALVVTNDAIAEGVHFLKGTDPKKIAQKAIRTNLSDIAAKGAIPFAISLALGLGKNCDEKWTKSFAKGLGEDCKHFGLNLCGGDTFSTNENTMVSVTAFGYIDKKDYASRLGAKSGHHLYVTGMIGDAGLGLAIALKRPDKSTTNEKFLIKRYEVPQPRIEAAALIARHASAAMDISDGFVGDLDKLCEASGVSASVHLAQIPISKQALSVAQYKDVPVTNLLSAGDDYELLIAVPKAKVVKFEDQARRLKFPVTKLCVLKAGKPMATILDSDEQAIEFSSRSYVHWGS